MGRKKIEIDWNVVDEKLSHFCNGTEVAAFLGMHEDTLYKRIEEKYKMGFSAYRAQKRAKGEMILRELQLKSAKEGNTSMLIWLGKQYLGQTDKTDHTSRGETIRPLEITVANKETGERIKKLIDESMLN